jgi:Fic family protein
MSSRPARRLVDVRYRPFAAFTAWPKHAIDTRRWDEVVARLARRRADAPPQAWARTRQAALRAATLDAARQADDTDLNVSGTEASWRQALASKGLPGVQALYEAEVRAHDLVAEAAATGATLTEELLLRTHEELVAVHEQYPVRYGDEVVLERVPRGAYKTYENYGVMADGNLRLYAPPDQVPAEVGRLVREAASDALAAAHPVVQAAYLLYGTDAVHPFADGNGRVARAAASLPLYRAVELPLVVTPRSRREYLTSLELATRGEQRGLIDFVFQRGVEAMTQASDILAASALS